MHFTARAARVIGFRMRLKNLRGLKLTVHGCE